MGIVLYHPSSASISMTQSSHVNLATPVSPLSDAFCRVLVQQYRFNLLGACRCGRAPPNVFLAAGSSACGVAV